MFAKSRNRSETLIHIYQKKNEKPAIKIIYPELHLGTE